jgi:hypothetical protein
MHIKGELPLEMEGSLLMASAVAKQFSFVLSSQYEIPQPASSSFASGSSLFGYTSRMGQLHWAFGGQTDH